MRLVDNSGGFWIDLIQRKKSPDFALKQMLIPEKTLMKKIGEEAISSIHGANKHKMVIEYKHNRHQYHAFPSGQYPFGILRHKSPEGEKWEPLDDSTIRHRRWKAEQGEIPTARGKEAALRETSQHIYYGLRIKSIVETMRSASVEIGWSGDDAELAVLQDKGGPSDTDWFGKGEKLSQVPARPFIGFQEEFVNNFFAILNNLNVKV